MQFWRPSVAFPCFTSPPSTALSVLSTFSSRLGLTRPPLTPKAGALACDVVGEGSADDMKDVAKESGLRRMLQRGPAFRARSWTWNVGTGPAIDVTPGTAMNTASLVRFNPRVRIFRARGRRCFIAGCARYGADCRCFLTGDVAGERSAVLVLNK